MAETSISPAVTGYLKRQYEISRLLTDVRPFLASDETYDILINPPARDNGDCTVWVDAANGGLRPTGLRMRPKDVFNLNRSIASELGRDWGVDSPILMGELPTDGSRVTALGYPVTRHGPALCLRKPSSRLLTFDDYVDSGALDGPPPAAGEFEEPPAYGHRAMIEYAFRQGWNVLFAGAPQAGKALDVETPILTPHGFRRMGDLRVGQHVIGRGGRAVRVMGVYPQGVKAAYRVAFADGAAVIACDGHLWTATVARTDGTSVIATMSLADVRCALAAAEVVSVAIPVVEPVEFAPRTLTLDPYRIGATIARDGIESDQLAHPEAGVRTLAAVAVGPAAGRGATATLNAPVKANHASRRQAARARRSANFIPDDYKTASVADRTLLLQGLLDAEGTNDAPGCVLFRTMSARLASDVAALARSLGCLARVARWSTFYHTIIDVRADLAPFRLSPQQGKFIPRTEPLLRSFEAIEPTTAREMVCIAVDAPDALFVVDGCIVTHNTTVANAGGFYTRSMTPDRRLYIIEDQEELRPEALPENVLRVQPSKGLGITESDLLQVALRVRPDGIVVAELLRPQAAYDFLAAMNTGVIGSYTTIHANSAHDALIRVETLIEQVPGIDVSPLMIASAIQLVVFIARLPNGKRRIKEVARVDKAIARGKYELTPIEPDLNPQRRLLLTS
jgi:Flp pilus assembly CpaF family ATPase